MIIRHVLQSSVLLLSAAASACSFSATDGAAEQVEAEQVGTASEAVTDPAAWGQVGYGPSRANYTPDETVLSASNVAGLTAHWSRPQIAKIWQASAAVAGGVVFEGSYGGQVNAYDSVTGSNKWTAPTNGSVRSGVAVGYGRVFATSNDRSLYVLSATTGHLIFKALHPKPIVGAAPLLWNGNVYVHCDDGKVYVYNARATSAPAPWTATVPGAVWAYGSSGDAAIGYGKLYVMGNGRLHAFDANGCGAATCEPLWSTAVLGHSTAGLAVASNRVFVPTQANGLYTVDATTGVVGWSNALDALAVEVRSVAVASGRVFVSLRIAGQPASQLWALSTQNGSLIWKAPLAFLDATAPTTANGVVYVGSVNYDTSTSALEAFGANCGTGGATCASLSSMTFPSALGIAAPAFAGGQLFLRVGGNLKAFGL